MKPDRARWVAKEAWLFFTPSIVASALFFALGWSALAFIFLLAAIFVLYFFRSPTRTSSAESEFALAPADGKVVRIDRASYNEFFPDGAISISIFLSIFDVHIQRAPLAGSVESKRYSAGKFMAAWSHEASQENERLFTLIKTERGMVGVCQIAGLIARRVVSWVEVGDDLERGEQIGLIRFGSRVDVFLPADFEILAREGDRVVGGVSKIAAARAPSTRAGGA